ncbi:MAG: prolyl-tRNA synthetase [Candidatus Moranbacteria bacterium]|nr:prolyl-tRNA synthetase [Candidatus Moranbacteria bacterium]
MRRSQFFIKTLTEAPHDETSTNAKLLVRGGFVDKLSAGVYTLLPLGLRVFNKIENIIREEMVAASGIELFMPSLHPKENWQKTGRWKTWDDLYKLKEGGKDLALGPTHEEIIVPLVKKFVNSYRDLPVALFQFQNKFRKEMRAKSGLLRGREFVMKDLYSFHADEKDLDQYYEKLKKTYTGLFGRLGLGGKTYLTFASGGSFSKYSHEFQTLTKAGEDIIYICDKCKIAFNKEIIRDIRNKCAECGNKKLREEKAVEVGNIFKLKDKYSKPFDLSFIGKDGKEKIALMCCFGIGLQRVLGTIVETHYDERGIIWPESVTPFQVILIGIPDKKGKKLQQVCEKIYEQLIKKNIEVLYDDRDASAGEKFADADLIGVPVRIVVSGKTLAKNSVELKNRHKKTTRLVKIDQLVSLFK